MTEQTVTLKQVREKLNPDSASYREGVFTIRDEFFYTHGRTADHLVRQVQSQFPTAVIHDSGEVWKAFRGWASTAQSSHWFVKFSVPERSALGGVIVDGIHCGRVVHS